MKEIASSSIFRMPRWGVAVVSAALALVIASSGGWSASAATPDGRSSGTGSGAVAGQVGQTSGDRAQDGTASPDGGQAFADVPPSNTFYAFVQNVYNDGIVSGYACGGVGEPCDSENRPYYRLGASVTRGQMSKFADLGRKNASIDVLTNLRVFAVRGESNVAEGLGVWGRTSGAGVRNQNQINAGVYANSLATGFDPFVAGSVGLLANSNFDVGAWVTTSKAPGAVNPYGLYVARNGASITRGTNPGTGLALYVEGPMQVTGGCTGCLISDIMLNTGEADLHIGDVAALGAVAPQGSEVNGNVVAGVAPASEAYSTGVVGVVSARYMPGDPSGPEGTDVRSGSIDTAATAIKPGEYMTVVTQGTVQMVKVDVGNGAIRVGDLLTTSSTAGAAMKVTDKSEAFGAVLGKALAPLESGTGFIPVLVTLK
jgi:hypothetical protein